MPYSCCAQQNVCREQAKVRAAANLFFTIETLVKEKKTEILLHRGQFAQYFCV